MQKMLKKLIELLPVSRRKLRKAVEATTIVLDGLIESDANHCQIEMSIIQQLHKNTTAKSSPAAKEKSNHDPAFN